MKEEEREALIHLDDCLDSLSKCITELELNKKTRLTAFGLHAVHDTITGVLYDLSDIFGGAKNAD